MALDVELHARFALAGLPDTELPVGAAVVDEHVTVVVHPAEGDGIPWPVGCRRVVGTGVTTAGVCSASAVGRCGLARARSAGDGIAGRGRPAASSGCVAPVSRQVRPSPWPVRRAMSPL